MFSIQQTLVLCVISVAAAGQVARKPAPKATPGEHRLSSIHVTGTQRYTQEEVIAASGLEIGKVAAEEDFQRAAKRLGESGFFTNVSYSYAYSPTGTRLDLTLVDSEKLVPVRFDNFVWFTDDELLARIHERLPLFRGQVPIGGNLSDQISDVLQALLVERNLSAHADYVRDTKEPGGPIDAVDFRANGVNLVVQEVRFSGAAPEELAALNAAAEKLVGTDYQRATVEAYAAAHLLAVYLERGFLRASISPPQAKVLRDTAEDTALAVQFTVTPGLQYKISELRWEGDTVVPAGKLQSLVHAAPGQTANASQLQTDLEKIRKLYGTVGYMEASLKPQPQFDDTNQTVSYTIAISEGEVFHLGDLDIQGVDAKSADRLRDAWTLRPTDPYDSSYPMRFFEQTVKLLSSGVTWTVSVHEGVNEQEKTVDVTLRYGLKPSS